MLWVGMVRRGHGGKILGRRDLGGRSGERFIVPSDCVRVIDVACVALLLLRPFPRFCANMGRIQV